jgi:hypothetical protein
MYDLLRWKNDALLLINYYKKICGLNETCSNIQETNADKPCQNLWLSGETQPGWAAGNASIPSPEQQSLRPGGI